MTYSSAKTASIASAKSDPHQVIGMSARIWATIINVGVTCLGIYFYVAAPQIKTMSMSFGTELPKLTAILINSFSYVWACLFISLTLQQGFLIALLVKRTFSIRQAFRMIAFVNLIVLVSLFVVLYAFIFKLGSVV